MNQKYSPGNADEHRGKDPGGHGLPIKQQTYGVGSTTSRPWAPVELQLALAVVPDEGDVLITEPDPSLWRPVH